MKGGLTARTRKAYDDGATYHDGKRVLLTVDSAAAVEDLGRLLAVKCKPKAAPGPP